MFTCSRLTTFRRKSVCCDGYTRMSDRLLRNFKTTLVIRSCMISRVSENFTRQDYIQKYAENLSKWL